MRNFNIIQGENLILMFNIVSFDLKKKTNIFISEQRIEEIAEIFIFPDISYYRG